ncbi:MAG: heme lyase CcmF/NrfE family subunit [Gammaproteobacteria bacterium]
MIAELGFLFLICSMVLSFIGSIMPIFSYFKKSDYFLNLVNPLTYLVFLFTSLSLLILVYSFGIDDFSIKYIAQNSNTNLPLYYKLSATWGAHEGSLLLWIFLLCAWTLTFSLKGNNETKNLSTSFLLQVIFLFSAFTIFTSNPFERYLPVVPLNGADLNPLLQDFAFTIHPPLLYLGYSGLAIPFAMAVSALLSGKVNQVWAADSRPWVLSATGFLTIGIAIGSWWAYYELGWGGWWFWDPVENAAFVPWLIAVALIHSLIVSQNRGHFKNWSILLAILAFSMSLLGTFLVRSGILTSVHSFALDPERGIFLLGIFSYFVLGSLFIFSIKYKEETKISSYTISSKEFGFLLNNVFLVVLGVSIMFGTLFPLIYEAIYEGDQISVGRPYYDTLIIPFAVALALLQAFALFFSWGRTENFSFIQKLFIYALLIFILISIINYLLYGELYFFSSLSLGLFSLILVANFLSLRSSSDKRNFRKLLMSKSGSLLAHLGTAFLVLGIGFVSSYSFEREVILSKGERYDLGGSTFIFKELSSQREANYLSDKADFEVEAGGSNFSLNTEKRFYTSSSQVMSEAGIKATLMKDYYVTIGEELNTGFWSFRIQVKTLIRWIWFGALLITIGSFISSRSISMSRNE